MKKLMLLALLVAGAFIVSASSTAQADHMSGCWSGGGGGYYGGNSYYAPSYYGGYSYAPVYNAPSYYSPGYMYRNGPVNSFGYGYPTTGFYFGRPGISVSIGSGYSGYNSSYGNYSTGGFGAGRSYYHHR